jgi:peptidoglycan/LPS O-acetylase OafA/YrhL
MPERADRYPEVDALRAIAAIAVLGTHAAIFAGADYPGSELGRYAQRLEVGLTIFFVISGFLLYRPFVAARLRRRDGPRTAAYAWRRLLRIAPAYWVALTLSALLVGKHEVFSADAPYYYLLGQTYSSETLPGGLTQAWTLCVEIAFYAALPVYALLAARLLRGRPAGMQARAELAAIAALALAVATWLAALIVAVVLGAAAGVAALMGKSKVQEAMPPVPEDSVESVKEDVQWTKTRAQQGRS